MDVVNFPWSCALNTSHGGNTKSFLDNYGALVVADPEKVRRAAMMSGTTKTLQKLS